MKPIFRNAIFSLLFLLSGVCFAEHEQEMPAEWDPSSAGPVTTWTAPVCSKGELVVQPFFFYNHTRGTFNDDGDYSSLPDNDKKSQVIEQLFMQYGLTDRLEVDVQTAYQQNYTTQSGVKADDAGLGDSYVFTRYCLLEEKDLRPHLTGLFQLKIPTGKFDGADPDKLETDVMGTGSWDPGVGLIASKKMKPFIFHADFSYNFPQEVKVDGVKTRYGDYLNYDFGAEYILPKGFNLLLEFNGLVQDDQEADGVTTPETNVHSFTASPGVGWSNDSIQTLVAYQRTLLGANTDANDSVVATVVYGF